MDEKDTYKYHLKEGRRIISRGVTRDINRVAGELERNHPNSRVQRIGRRTTHDAAVRWRREGGKRPYNA
jgi:hypothetical protein